MRGHPPTTGCDGHTRGDGHPQVSVLSATAVDHYYGVEEAKGQGRGVHERDQRPG